VRQLRERGLSGSIGNPRHLIENLPVGGAAILELL
jgi:hypothetical protein